MFKIEFDPSNTALAAAIGRALTEYAAGGAEQKECTPYERTDMELKTAGVQVNALKTAGTAAVQDGEKVKTDAASSATEPASTIDHSAEETAAGAAAQAGSDASNAHAGAGSVDEKGVTKDDDYCATAKVPFYGTGKRKGQWKKRQGVDEDEYDEWYASELAKVVKTETPQEETKVDTAAAFGKKQEPTNTAAGAPQNGGDFMTWISEQQNAGNITQADLDAAYYATGVQVGDLFGAAGGEAVAKMYNELSK